MVNNYLDGYKKGRGGESMAFIYILCDGSKTLRSGYKIRNLKVLK